MNKVIKIGILEAIAFMIIVLINRIILNTPKEIIDTTGSSAWLNVIVISIISILFILLICKLYKHFIGKDIIDISKYLGGNTLKIITSIIFFLFFISINATILRNFCDSLQAIFLQGTSIIYILSAFIITIVIVNKLGISSIIKVNVIIICLILLSIIIIFFLPIADLNFYNLFPIFGRGINETFFYGLTNLFAFSGIAYLFFLMPLLKQPAQFKKIALISIIISSIYLFLSVVSLTGLFSYLLTSENILAVLLVTRIISMGSFFQRIDAFFILIWIFTFLSYFSIIFYFVLYTFKNIINISNQNGMIYSIATLVLGLSLIPKNIIEVNYFENTILKYSILVIVFIYPLLLLILANLKHKKKRKINKKEVNF